MKMLLSGGAVLTAALLAGCSANEAAPPPFQPASVNAGRPAIPTDPGSQVDRPGVLQREHEETDRRRAKGRSGDAVSGVAPVVEENVKAPWAALNVSSTLPAARHATTHSATSGQYMTLGGVVAEINSTPIYADKVLAQIEPVLAARAKELDPVKFRALALKEIHDQVEALIKLELEFAAASKHLDSQDKQLADHLTQQWRQHKIAEAQGSEELARRRFGEQGQNFDDVVSEQYRVFMSQIYYQKKLVPRIQVSAQDLRDYYDKHLRDEFNEPDKARFRLIKILVSRAGDKQTAQEKVRQIRERIVSRGEDFAKVAAVENHDTMLQHSGGLTGEWINRGAFAQEKVEQAVWATPAGEVTPIIDGGDAIYIAKVEEKKNGRTVPFDEEGVQQKIREKLRASQFRDMREQVQKELLSDAIVRSDPNMVNIAVDMAMENYPAWSQKSAGG